MPGLKNTEIECCNPGCANRGVTDDGGELPPGWNYRLGQSRDDGEVILIPICPDCSNDSF